MPSHCDHCEAAQPLGVVVEAGGAVLVVVVVTWALVVVEVIRVVEDDVGALVVLLLLGPPPTGGAPVWVRRVSLFLRQATSCVGRGVHLPGPATEVVISPLSM